MNPADILADILTALNVAQLGAQIIQQMQADGSATTTAQQMADLQAAQANAVSASNAWLAALAAHGVVVPANQ